MGIEIKKELKYLNHLLILSYGYTFEGRLVPPGENEKVILQCASDSGVPVLFLLAPFSAGAFNSQLIRILMENREIQDRVIGSVCETAERKGYAGVEVELEYVQPENKFKYADFIGRLRAKMQKIRKTVSVSVVPKRSDRDKGMAEEGLDYRAIGENADTVCIAAYGWGGIYGPPYPASPLNRIRETVEYAVTRIAPEKLLLGIPGYGYDWMLPYERGLTRAGKISNEEAFCMAQRLGVRTEYAELAQTPWFCYRSGGMEHTVWFEDPYSIRAKTDLARRYGLAGIRCRELQCAGTDGQNGCGETSLYIQGIQLHATGV